MIQERRDRFFGIPIGFVVVAIAGCQPSGGAGSGGATSGAGRLTPDEFSSQLDLGDRARLDFLPDVPRSVVVQVPLRELAALQADGRRPIDGSISLSKSAVRLVKSTTDARRNLQSIGDRAEVSFAFAPAAEANVCESGLPAGAFTLILNEAGDDFSIEPPSVALGADAIDVLIDPSLQTCLQVSANYSGHIEIDGVDVRFGLAPMSSADGVDRASVRLIAGGQDIARFETGDGQSFVSVGLVPQLQQGGGYVQIAFAQVTGTLMQAQIFIIIDDDAELNGSALPLTELPIYVQAIAVTGAAQFGGQFCRAFDGLPLPCGVVPNSTVSGTISLRRASERISGSFDFSLSGFGGAGTVRAVGEIDLPESFNQTGAFPGGAPPGLPPTP